MRQSAESEPPMVAILEAALGCGREVNGMDSEMNDLIHRARDVAGRMEVLAALTHGDGDHYTADQMAKSAAIIAELIERIEGRGECICGKCGLRHGGSIVRVDF